ncbi:hypothetical protein NLG97_g3909 [Lecanicillium saksenae]|uniref:Uncharacterized protein n=1 Tax=Lecanicillium saksenae TaxID=468837 RepID=A0ACC1QYI4_9HYPO|nr:hypothetical protein NLG97_g3909 [Lecanicillium saksenae]
MRIASFLPSLISIVGAVSSRLHSHKSDLFSPDIILRITRENYTIGNIVDRYTTLINGSVPGPTLRIPEEKVVWIRVYNDMRDANLTMHWHGLSLAAFPFSDGSPLASQWPIPPLHYFDYEIKASKGSAGTYFYHSHIGLQALTAAGAFIVEDTGPPPYPVDGEEIITLQEIYHRTEDDITDGLRSFDYYWVQEPDILLINGKGLQNATNETTINAAHSSELAVIDVEPDQTYRFRFIGAMGASLIVLAFENHTSMDVIQADGAYTKPLTVSALQFGPGQRYDAILRSKTCEELAQLAKSDFYLQLENRVQPYHVTGFAVLRYHNTKCHLENTSRLPLTTLPAGDPPLTLPPVDYSFLDYKLQPLVEGNPDYEKECFPAAHEVTRRVIFYMQEMERGYGFYVVNNTTLTEDNSSYPGAITMPNEPYLVSMYKNQTAHLPDYDAAVRNGGLDPRTKTYPARVGEVIEIVMQQYGSDRIDHLGVRGKSFVVMHPWHAHGAKFWDAGGGDGKWDPEIVEERLVGTQPVRRDTTMLSSYRPFTEKPGVPSGWRVWRLRITQPGVWVVHCHTLPHVIQGLQTIWVHGEAEDLLKVGKPHVDGYLEYGGNVYGNISHYPSVPHFEEWEKI